ncbi:four helix bundle protein [Brevundimonas sp. FT23028]|uniref:four helix bundle protein n=1 Tax=Brevundimonas sp. FT23028 TaxID=3393748 RepID=UPI003B585AB5
MSEVPSYRDLIVWQRAMDVAAATYALTRGYPRDELFGLTSQSRRAAASIAANIAEGYGRASKQAYVNFLRIAQGSLKEPEPHLILPERVEITNAGAIQPLLEQTEEIGRMLKGRIGKLQAHPGKQGCRLLPTA